MSTTRVGDRVRICVNGTPTAPAFLTSPRVVTWVNPNDCKTIRYGVSNTFATSWVKLRPARELVFLERTVEVEEILGLARNGGGMDPPETEDAT